LEDQDAAIGQTALLDRNATSSLVDAVPKFKLVLDAHWTMSRWSVNLREDIYGPSSQWVSLDGSGEPGTPGVTDTKIGTSPITDHRCRLQSHRLPADRYRRQQFVRLEAATVPTVDNAR
jgi:hypothetical protein